VSPADRAALLREAADAIEDEANRISSPGHLRAWWVIAQLRTRADEIEAGLRAPFGLGGMHD
jgi:hypothetical protein